MNGKLEKDIYSALHKFVKTSGIGSSPTANEIVKVVRPYYQNAGDEEKKAIIVRLEKLRQEPGVSLPTNLEQMLSK